MKASWNDRTPKWTRTTANSCWHKGTSAECSGSRWSLSRVVLSRESSFSVDAFPTVVSGGPQRKSFKPHAMKLKILHKLRLFIEKVTSLMTIARSLYKWYFDGWVECVLSTKQQWLLGPFQTTTRPDLADSLHEPVEEPLTEGGRTFSGGACLFCHGCCGWGALV